MSLSTRSFFDYIKFILRLRTQDVLLFSIDLLVLLLSIPLLPTQQSLMQSKNNLFIIAIFVIFLLRVGWKSWRIVKKMSFYFTRGDVEIKNVDTIISRKSGEYPIKDLLPSPKGNSYSFEVSHYNIPTRVEAVIHSDYFDTYLWDNEISAYTDDRKRDIITERMKARSTDYIKVIKHNVLDQSVFYNDDKLCLSEDPCDVLDRPDNHEICCHKGTYWESFLTNEMCHKIVENINNSEVELEGTHIFPVYIHKDREMRISDITTSKMNNHIGVSTVAFTKDGYLMLCRQSPKAQISSGLLQPTASGSLDWNDWTEGSLTESVRAGMERELKEETQLLDISDEKIGPTQIVGYSRWVKRGGKPEFVGITRVEVGRRVMAGSWECFEIEDYRLHDYRSLDHLLSELRNKSDISVSLHVVLYALHRYATIRTSELDTFIH